MMKKEVFGVYDLKACLWLPPFVAVNGEAAKRQFADMALTPGTVLSQHPADFSLYLIGNYHEQTGHLEKVDHEFVCNAGELLSHLGRVRTFVPGAGGAGDDPPSVGPTPDLDRMNSEGDF